MVEKEIKILKIQPRKKGGAQMVTVPTEIVKALKIKGGEKVKALFDQENGRIIYELL